MKNIELLKTVSLFWDLNKIELGHISDKMVSKKFENGNLIFLEESEGKNLFFVVIFFRLHQTVYFVSKICLIYLVLLHQTHLHIVI